MNWHTRYAQQANWTQELRSYIFEKTELTHAQRVLEVGCGTGAILSTLPPGPASYGLDIDHEALTECKLHAPRALPIQGNALSLPFPDLSFDIVYCHFLLLWVGDPLQALREMKRVTQRNGYVIAFAEPDYLKRTDQPEELVPLGKWQSASLRKQGADLGLGVHLAELFFEAGMRIIETGIIQSKGNETSLEDWNIEWAVLESDLRGQVPDHEIQRMKDLDQQARSQGIRVLNVPTYFAWGQV